MSKGNRRRNPQHKNKPAKQEKEREQEYQRQQYADRRSKKPRPRPQTAHNYWMQLRKKWKKLNNAEKITCVIIGLMLLGLSIAAIYYCVQPIVDNLNRQYCPGLKRIKGNSYTARLTLIGEYHTKKPITRACVERRSPTNGESHIVLLESAPRGLTVSCEDFKIPNRPGRICRGWDDRAYREKLHHQLLDEFYNGCLKNLTTILTSQSHQPIAIYRQTVARSHGILQKKFKKKAESIKRTEDSFNQIDYSNAELAYLIFKTNLQVFSDILEKLDTGTKPDQLFEQLQRRIDYENIGNTPNWNWDNNREDIEGRVNVDDPKLVASMSTRQQSLLEAIKDALETTSRVIATAGLFHVVPPPGRAGESVSEFREELDGTFPGQYEVFVPVAAH